MKTYTREKAIRMILDGKQMTGNKFPDETYCIYDNTEEQPFRYITQYGNEVLKNCWDSTIWIEYNYIPKDKELVWCWDNVDKATAELRYYDTKNNCTFNYKGGRNDINYNNYAPFDGIPSPNICKPEDLED